MRRIVAIAMLLALAIPVVAVAQTSDYTMHPPKVLVIGREDVKPGRGPAHEKSEAAWTQAFVRAQWPAHFLGMSAISGPGQVWFCTGYDSFADMEKDNQAGEKSAAITAALNQYGPAETDFLSGSRQLIATYKEDLSHRPNFNLAQMRYFRVRMTRVKFGHDAEYGELRKLLNSAFEKAGQDLHAVTYQVMTGAPAGTYLTFYPSKSAAEWDQQSPALPQLLGDDYGKFQSLVEKSVAGYEDTIFQFSNKMSYPSQEMIAADPGFWTPKPVMATGKPVKKGAVIPAAKEQEKK